MKCPKCESELKEVKVSVHGAKQKAISYQCPKGDYFEFEPISSAKVIEELRETPLKMKQMKKTVPKKIDVGVYWAPVNDKESPYYNPKEKKGKVYFDVESMQEEFSIKMKKLIKDHGSKQCIKDWEDEV